MVGIRDQAEREIEVEGVEGVEGMEGVEEEEEEEEEEDARAEMNSRVLEDLTNEAHLIFVA